MLGPRSGILNLAGATARQGSPRKGRMHYHSLLWGKCRGHTRRSAIDSLQWLNLRTPNPLGMGCKVTAGRGDPVNLSRTSSNKVMRRERDETTAGWFARSICTSETDVLLQVYSVNRERRQKCIALTHHDRLLAFLSFCDLYTPAAFGFVSSMRRQRFVSMNVKFSTVLINCNE